MDSRMAARQVYLHIVLPGTSTPVPCAAFSRTEVGADEWVGNFGYGRQYLARPDAVPLDPLQLPLTERIIETTRREGFPGAVRDSMPDFWGRVVIDRERGGPLGDELEYLLAAGADRVGAVIATPTRNAPHVQPPPAVSLERLLEAARQLADELDAEDEDHTVVNERASVARSASAAAVRRLAEDAAGLLIRTSQLGGARPKALLADQGRLWLAKFPKRQDRWNNPLVEGAMLTLAQRAGITVPAHQVVRVGAQTVLLVERFDRGTDANGNVTRARYLSALTLFDSDDHASSVNEWSYPVLADQLGLVSDTPDSCRRELFRRMVFNACITNDDDHARNHAVIAPGDTFRLSPAYDLTPTPQHGRERQLAMATGFDDAGVVTRRANAAVMLRAAPRFGGLSEAEAVAVIAEVWSIVSRDWEQVIRDGGGTGRDLDQVRSAMCPDVFWDDWPSHLRKP
jgi:serine/threonine-protein kinase HipA